MSSEVWLPLVTLVLGIMLGYVADWLRERRTAKRDQRERWKTLQRDTILEAQAALANVVQLQASLAMAKVLDTSEDNPDKADPRGFARLLSELFHTLHLLTAYSWRLSDAELSVALSAVVNEIMERFEALQHTESSDIDMSSLGDALVRFNLRANEVLPGLC